MEIVLTELCLLIYNSFYPQKDQNTLVDALEGIYKFHAKPYMSVAMNKNNGIIAAFQLRRWNLEPR